MKTNWNCRCRNRNYRNSPVRGSLTETNALLQHSAHERKKQEFFCKIKFIFSFSSKQMKSMWCSSLSSSFINDIYFFATGNLLLFILNVYVYIHVSLQLSKAHPPRTTRFWCWNFVLTRLLRLLIQPLLTSKPYIIICRFEFSTFVAFTLFCFVFFIWNIEFFDSLLNVTVVFLLLFFFL